MAYLTAQEYVTITGQTAPDDFDALEAQAETAIDRYTLCRLWGRPLSGLPDIVANLVRRGAAHQVQYLSQCGGVGVLNDMPFASAALGKFSFSAGLGTGESPLLQDDLDVVNAYLREVTS